MTNDNAALANNPDRLKANLTDQPAGGGRMRDVADMYHRPDAPPPSNSDMAIERLHQIAHIAKVAAAASDTCNNIPGVPDAIETLQEVIYRLALEGVDFAESAEKGRKNRLEA